MHMKRKLIFGVTLIALALNLAIGARTFSLAKESEAKDTVYPNLELFSTVLERVRRDYVDGGKLTYQELVRNALKGMVGELDPHSEFMDPESFKELQDDTQGSFGGIGVVVSMRDNYLTVVAPMDDSPGFRAGVLTGDRILKIAGKSTERLSLQDAVKTLRGEPGTDVSLTILRPANGLTKELKLTREAIAVDMVKDLNGKKEFPVGADKLGYVRLVQFGEKTGPELESAIKKLKAQGMQAMVLDLRWNPGGLLDQAVEVCGKFLPRGQLVVTTEGRNPAQNTSHSVRGRGDLLRGKDGAAMPLVVLVNLGSASASEIVAGCLQDTKRAYLVGETTFGKGSVQSVLPLPDGSGLRLTTAKYYTPSHKVIHEHGVTPDSLVPMTEEAERDIVLQKVPGGIESLEELEQLRVRSARDAQLERAQDVLKGILLYTERAPTTPAKPTAGAKLAAR
jgi:carboxyl-terminal processing protease